MTKVLPDLKSKWLIEIATQNSNESKEDYKETPFGSNTALVTSLTKLSAAKSNMTSET